MRVTMAAALGLAALACGQVDCPPSDTARLAALQAEVRELRDENAAMKAANAGGEAFREKLSEIERTPPQSAPAEPAPLPPAAAVPQPAVSPVEATNARARVTESNSSSSRFAWRLDLANRSGATLQVRRLEVQFVDADGFTIDTDDEYGIVLGPGEVKVVSGDDLIDAKVAPRVRAVRPVIK